MAESPKRKRPTSAWDDLKTIYIESFVVALVFATGAAVGALTMHLVCK